MLNYVGSRILGGVITIWFVMSLVFVLAHATGDPVTLMASPYMSTQDVANLRHHYGLDAPLPVQYGRYVGNLVTGDFGKSVRYGESSFGLYMSRLPETLKLVGVAMAISLLVGVPVGLAAGMRPEGRFDRFAKVLALAGQSVPSFWLGIMLIIWFAVDLGVVPTSGDRGVRSMILPGLTLSTYAVAALVRLTRSSVLEVKDAEFVNLLWAKGLSSGAVVWKHILKNAALPVLTLASLQLIGFLSGSVIVEQIFSWPGVGRLAIDAVGTRDFPVIQMVVVATTTLLVLINLGVDLAYGLIDPRVRLAGA